MYKEAMREFHGFTPFAIYYFFTRCVEHVDIDSIFQTNLDDRLKGSSLAVLNEDSDTTPNSEGSQLTEPSTADLHLSMLVEQGKAMVALLQSSVDEQKKDTDEWNQMQSLHFNNNQTPLPQMMSQVHLQTTATMTRCSCTNKNKNNNSNRNILMCNDDNDGAAATLSSLSSSSTEIIFKQKTVLPFFCIILLWILVCCNNNNNNNNNHHHNSSYLYHFQKDSGGGCW